MSDFNDERDRQLALKHAKFRAQYSAMNDEKLAKRVGELTEQHNPGVAQRLKSVFSSPQPLPSRGPGRLHSPGVTLETPPPPPPRTPSRRELAEEVRMQKLKDLGQMGPPSNEVELKMPRRKLSFEDINANDPSTVRNALLEQSEPAAPPPILPPSGPASLSEPPTQPVEEGSIYAPTEAQKRGGQVKLGGTIGKSGGRYFGKNPPPTPEPSPDHDLNKPAPNPASAASSFGPLGAIYSSIIGTSAGAHQIAKILKPVPVLGRATDVAADIFDYAFNPATGGVFGLPLTVPYRLGREALDVAGVLSKEKGRINAQIDPYSVATTIANNLGEKPAEPPVQELSPDGRVRKLTREEALGAETEEAKGGHELRKRHKA